MDRWVNFHHADVLFHFVWNVGEGQGKSAVTCQQWICTKFWKGVIVDVTNVKHYEMRAALKLLYNYIYAKLDGCVL